MVVAVNRDIAHSNNNTIKIKSFRLLVVADATIITITIAIKMMATIGLAAPDNKVIVA